MFQPIQFRPEVDALVRFVEETPPARIVEATCAKLREGLPVRDILAANALAVVRSTELPAQHHGGPLHPICGIHAVHEVARRLPGEGVTCPCFSTRRYATTMFTPRRWGRI